MINAVNPKVSVDQLVLKSLYYRYKDFIVPVTTIAVCAVLFMYVIMPQIQSWLDMKDAVSGDTDKLLILKQNLKIISALDDTKLDTYLQLSSNALPTDKDFESILQALSNAAANTGTSLGDYSLPIGDLVTADTKASSSEQSMQMSINLKGDLETGRSFIAELKKQLPLSDVNAITVNNNGTLSLTLVFYFAPLPKITFDDSVPLQTLSPKDEEVLKLLNVSQPDQTSVDTSTPATSSAAPATSSAAINQ